MAFTVVSSTSKESTGKSEQMLWVYTAGRCRQAICPPLCPLWGLVEKHEGCAEVSLDSDWISFSGDIQDPPGRGPVQPAVGDPASAGGLD